MASPSAPRSNRRRHHNKTDRPRLRPGFSFALRQYRRCLFDVVGRKLAKVGKITGYLPPGSAPATTRHGRPGFSFLPVRSFDHRSIDLVGSVLMMPPAGSEVEGRLMTRKIYLVAALGIVAAVSAGCSQTETQQSSQFPPAAEAPPPPSASSSMTLAPSTSPAPVQ